MEIRAGEEVEFSRDITPAIAPLAIALHDRFLSTRCSSCFARIPPPSRSPAAEADGYERVDRRNIPPPCRGCQTLRYCSSECRDSDIDSHISGGECNFLRLVQFDRREETTDLRTAIRLLGCFKTLGLSTSGGQSQRIGGLLFGNLERMEDDCELRLRMREGRFLMTQAREMLRKDDEAEMEAALGAVLTNGVEVQIGEEHAVGIGVYGPQFSWFNHSCSPNACFRFELRDSNCFYSQRRSLLHPFSSYPMKEDMMRLWIQGEGKLDGEASCTFAPRVVVRCIRPIKKGEHVSISYTDLLQPKELRQRELWSKYAFICSCPRCNASPESLVDCLLSGTKSVEGYAITENPLQETEKQANIVDEILMEYLSDGNPKLCIAKMEQILSNGFKKGNLQPLNYLSLKAYMGLASMHRAQAYDHGREDARAAAAYALLLACSTHHLFLFDPSLILAAVNFWADAGEAFLSLAQLSVADREVIFEDHSSSLSWDEFSDMSSRFLYCTRRISSRVWPTLTCGLECLAKIRSPVDFSSLEENKMGHEYLGVSDHYNGRIKCIGCNFTERDDVEDVDRSIQLLIVHCLVYSAYLGSVCYGPGSYRVDYIRSLVCGNFNG